jgi:hypothetical protein
MKRIALVTAVLLAGLAAAGCSRGTAPPASSAPALTAVVMPAGTPAPTNDPDSTGTPAEEFETAQPLLTPWPEPAKVDYTGKYLDVAQDRPPANYPKLKLAGAAVETTWGSLKLPQGWTVTGADGPEPVIKDGKGRTVGAIYPLTSIPTEPYFSLMNEEDTLISWEIPDYPMDARVLTYEQRTTDENGKSKELVMGCYGIGVTRTMAAAIEQNYDANGMIWPVSIAPYHIVIVPVSNKDTAQMALAEQLYQEMFERQLSSYKRPYIKIFDYENEGEVY